MAGKKKPSIAKASLKGSTSKETVASKTMFFSLEKTLDNVVKEVQKDQQKTLKSAEKLAKAAQKSAKDQVKAEQKIKAQLKIAKEKDFRTKSKATLVAVEKFKTALAKAQQKKQLAEQDYTKAQNELRLVKLRGQYAQKITALKNEFTHELAQITSVPTENKSEAKTTAIKVAPIKIVAPQKKGRGRPAKVAATANNKAVKATAKITNKTVKETTKKAATAPAKRGRPKSEATTPKNTPSTQKQRGRPKKAADTIAEKAIAAKKPAEKTAKKPATPAKKLTTKKAGRPAKAAPAATSKKEAAIAKPEKATAKKPAAVKAPAEKKSVTAKNKSAKKNIKKKDKEKAAPKEFSEQATLETQAFAAESQPLEQGFSPEENREAASVSVEDGAFSNEE